MTTGRPDFIPHPHRRLPAEEMFRRAEEFFAEMQRRRSVRDFSPEPVPRELIELAIRTASTAPSGAHRQPWRFVAVDDPAIKRRIRVAAEDEERRQLRGRPLPARVARGPGPARHHLGEAPPGDRALAGGGVRGAVRRRRRRANKRKNYYVKESVGIACGLFIAALHHMGLATLTHTPSPMRFLSEILGRPANEKPYILFPVGYPAADARVPDLRRKSLDEVAVWNPAK